MSNYCSIIDSPLGPVSIFADENVVVEITFAEAEPKNYPENDLTTLAARELIAYFHEGSKSFSFPFKQTGTDFQQEVWRSLMEIPYADTTSYAKFSAHKPLAIRAIAAANGKNKLAIVVPCHRVIGSDGKLVGYAGGLWRKKWLLQHEREMVSKGQTELKF
ncbi:methylated-DNA--[protein]-cysteine S-methyltransferase [Pedobacter sp. PWIIR3]